MPTTRHLDDEHMRLYEWSGAGTGMPHRLPTGSKRSHAWHASYGVLAVLTSLLVLYGGDGQAAAGLDVRKTKAEAARPDGVGGARPRDGAADARDAD